MWINAERSATVKTARHLITRSVLTGNRPTNFDVVGRGATLCAGIAVLEVQPKSASCCMGSTACFELLHGGEGFWLTVYDYIRVRTALTIKYFVLCRGGTECEAQECRSR